VIRDNCGGMSLNDAVDYAFSFGPDTEEQHSDYSIGVYGIGMKRAAFKLGTKIDIRSTHKPDGGEAVSFVVPIDVPRWLTNDEPPWDFDIEEAAPLDHAGVEIVVSTLTDETSASFDSPAFVQNLRRIIGRDYSLHLNRGLNIEVNDVPVKGWQLDFRQSEEFSPVRLEYEDEVGETKVKVELIGGMASPPPEATIPTRVKTATDGTVGTSYATDASCWLRTRRPCPVGERRTGRSGTGNTPVSSALFSSPRPKPRHCL